MFFFSDVRIAAVEQIVDMLSNDGQREDMDYLLTLAESDPVPRVRYLTLLSLARNPPFRMGQSHKLDNEHLVERLWNLMKYVEVRGANSCQSLMCSLPES